MATPARVLPDQGLIRLRLFDGTRQPFASTNPVLVRIIDGQQRQLHIGEYNKPDIDFNVPFSDNFADNYRVLASAKGYEQAGFVPVRVSPRTPQTVELMLLPHNGAFNFRNATWKQLRKTRPDLIALLSHDLNDAAAAEERYTGLIENSEKKSVLACFLNLTTAMTSILLPTGNVLSHCKELIWKRMAQDRFFAYAHPDLIEQVETAKSHRTFTDAPAGLHPRATRSYKEIRFGEANVQLTFYENDRKPIGGVDCVMVEPDIDYFSDTLAHLLLEVLPNTFGSITDPKVVYVLRWIAGRHAGIPEFDPLYTIVPA